MVRDRVVRPRWQPRRGKLPSVYNHSSHRETWRSTRQSSGLGFAKADLASQKRRNSDATAIQLTLKDPSETLGESPEI
jgi:hypothetical protein